MEENFSVHILFVMDETIFTWKTQIKWFNRWFCYKRNTWRTVFLNFNMSFVCKTSSDKWIRVALFCFFFFRHFVCVFLKHSVPSSSHSGNVEKWLFIRKCISYQEIIVFLPCKLNKTVPQCTLQRKAEFI